MELLCVPIFAIFKCLKNYNKSLVYIKTIHIQNELSLLPEDLTPFFYYFKSLYSLLICFS